MMNQESNIQSVPVEEQKVQLTCFDISGNLYLQKFYKSVQTAMRSQRKASEKYGAYLRYNLQSVPKTQRYFTHIPTPGSQYCFCPNTPLHVSKCPSCGKRPYTD